MFTFVSCCEIVPKCNMFRMFCLKMTSKTSGAQLAQFVYPTDQVNQNLTTLVTEYTKKPNGCLKYSILCMGFLPN